jgi:hypothetical protein
VGNSIESARTRLIQEVLSTAQLQIPFDKKTGDLQLGYLDLIKEYPYYKIEKWWFLNVCINIITYNSPIDLPVFAREVQDQIEDAKNLIDKLSDYLPVIKGVRFYNSAGKPFAGKLTVGQEVTVQVTPASNPNLAPNSLMLDFLLTGESLQLVAENREKMELTFKGIKPGEARVQFILLDQDTLLCSDSALWEETIIQVTKK